MNSRSPTRILRGANAKVVWGAVGCQSRRLQLESEISAQLIEGPFYMLLNHYSYIAHR